MLDPAQVAREAGAASGWRGQTGGMAGGFVCMNPFINSDKTVTVAPTAAMKASSWEKCAASGDCFDLCFEQLPIPTGGSSVSVTTCVRVDPPLPADAGTDGGGDSRDAASGGVADASIDATSDDAGPHTVTIHVVGGAGVWSETHAAPS